MIGRRFGAAVLSAVFCVIVGFGSAAALAAEIGVAAAVQNEVEGVQSGASRALAAGSQVFQDETIRTGVQSMAQLLFLDETSLSIGPLSDVTLDRFVYNPATGAGDVVLSTTKGAFRFITGSQDPTNYKLNTPFASIGVRGTIVDCYSSAIGLYCTAQEGTVIIVIGGVEYVLQPGEALFVAADGTVEGPFTPDGQFFEVTGISPWPLFGAFLPGCHEQVEVTDGSTIRLDEIFEQTPPCDDIYDCDDQDGGF